MNKFSKINLIQIFILAFLIDSCSYPEMIRNELVYVNKPMTELFNTGMAKICTNSFFGEKTTLHQIEKLFKSSCNNEIVRFYNELYQPNVIDKDCNAQQKFDKSRSRDNIRVRSV